MWKYSIVRLIVLNQQLYSFGEKVYLGHAKMYYKQAF